MAQTNSIWRWTIEADLNSLFSTLVRADDAEFARIAAAHASEGAQSDDMAALAARTEAQMRLRGLPEDVLATMLKGLEAMQQENADWAAAAAEDAGLELALASSHAFAGGPGADIPGEERAAQAQRLFGTYRLAMAQAMAEPGAPLSKVLALNAGDLERPEMRDQLQEHGVSPASWVWEGSDAVHALNQMQEAPDFPIDLTLVRLSPVAFAALGAAISGP